MSEHRDYNCQCETVALPKIDLTTRKVPNSVIREWRRQYLRGFGQAAYDLNHRGIPDITFLSGFAFNAFTMGYRTGVAAAKGR